MQERSRVLGAVKRRTFFQALGLAIVMLATAPPLAAEVVSVLCEDADSRDPYPPMTFHLDLGNGTAEYTGTSAFKVPARVSERSISWSWGSNRYNLDRTSGVLNRVVEGQYTSTWRCRKVTGSAI
jgi:hypothetical protein